MKPVFNPYNLEHIARAMQWLKDIKTNWRTPYPFQNNPKATRRRKKKGAPTKGILKRN